MIMKSLVVLLGAVALDALAAMAESPAPPSAADDPSQRDSLTQFQQLKYQALQLAADGERAQLRGPANAALYVGNAANPLKLRHVSITFDGQPLAEQEIDPAAFNQRGAGDRLIRVGRVASGEGSHAVHAEFQVVALSSPDTAAQTVTMDESLQGEPDLAGISLTLEASSVVSPVHVALQQYRMEANGEGWILRTLHEVERLGGLSDRYQRGERGDPAVAYAEYLRNAGQADQAAVELMTLSTGADDTLPPEYWLRTAAALREAGLWDYSRAICDRLDARHHMAQAVAVERLRIALSDYDAGDVAQAEQGLQAIEKRLPDDRVQDWQLAYAQILFQHDRYPEAEKVLQDRDKEDTEAFRYMSQSNQAMLTTAFRHYNLAVAMVHNGEEKKGLSLLDLLGRTKTTDKALIAVRDQANLTLGWHFLRKKQGITAMGALGRVGMEGRWSAPALLGMGWAQLAPAGDKIERVRLDREPGNGLAPLPAPLKHSLTTLGVFDPELDESGGPASFKRGDPPQDETEGLKRALMFWQVLARREPGEPAVLEGMLAIAYAYEKLEDDASARQAYAEAIARLEARRSGLIDEAGAVRSQGLAALARQTTDAGTAAPMLGAGYLAPTEQNRAVFSAVERYRDYGKLLNALNASARPSESGDTADAAADDLAARSQALQDAITAARQAGLNDLQDQAVQDLVQRTQQTDRYLQAGYFASARLSERTLAYDGH